MIYEPRITYKPFELEWCYHAWDNHERKHWTQHDIVLNKDVEQYAKAPVGLRTFITKILFGFTQQDVDVGEYFTRYVCNTFPKPEIRMMATSFAAREGVHMASYALFADTIGLGDEAFTEFQNIPVLAARHDFFEEYRKTIQSSNWSKPVKDYMTIVTYSGLGEGLSLFTSFGLLLALSMKEINLFPGLETIINYSIKDERMHYTYMLKLAKEELYTLMTPDEKRFVENEFCYLVQKLYEIESAFLNYVFSDSGITHITVKDMQDYILTIIDERKQYLFEIEPETVERSTKIEDWVTAKTGNIKEQFFEVTTTAYTVGGLNMSKLDNCSFTFQEV